MGGEKPASATAQTTQLGHRLLALFFFLRPQIALQATVYVLLSVYLSGAQVPLLRAETLIAGLVVALTVAFGFVINDCVDCALDRATKPTRPLPSGAVTLGAARGLGLLTATLVLVSANFVSEPLRLIAWLNLGLTAAYSLWLKRTVLWGNLAIALLNSSLILFGALAGAGLSPLIWSIASSTFSFSLAQELLYTVDDLAGDQQAGLVTTAVYCGAERTLWLFRLLIGVAAWLSLLPLVLGVGSPFYLLLLVPCTLLPIFLWIIPLTFRRSDTAISAACQALKRVRISSLIPLLFLRPFF